MRETEQKGDASKLVMSKLGSKEAWWGMQCEVDCKTSNDRREHGSRMQYQAGKQLRTC